MSNPTSNFGWQMPTNTDLVTNLPADFEVFGQAVDSDFADLKGGTSGQILSKNSNTDLDFVWVNNQVGDITSITATTPLTGGGTIGDVTVGIQAASTTQSGAVQLIDSTSSTSTTTAATPNSVKTAFDTATTANATANAAIPKSTVTTNGDVIYGTGSSAVTRLPIGSSGQVLTVSGGIPAWGTPAAGGMTLLSTTTLSGASTTISSISQGYKTLYALITGVTHTGTPDALAVKPNGVTSGIDSSVYYSIGTTTYNIAYQNSIFFVNFIGTTVADTENSFVLQINNYTSTTTNKPMFAYGQALATSGSRGTSMSFGGDRQNAAITSLTFAINVGGTSFTGGTIELYGVK
jgi:hypothetical protein